MAGISDVFSPVTNAVTSGTAKTTGFGGGWMIFIGIVIGLIIISVIGGVIYYYFYMKRQWNIVTRVHYENPAINGVSLGGAVLTKRVRFKDGRVVYMYKTPIQGYNISPELLTWTRPKEHDVIITQDKKLFTLVGINSIDVQRKKLNVDVAYPDIEMDRQDLQQHIDSKKFDDPNERFKLIAKVAIWAFVIIGIIVVTILGGKTYIDSKNINLERDKINLQVSSNQAQVMNGVNTFLLILSKTMPESFHKIDGQNLLADLKNNNSTIT